MSQEITEITRVEIRSLTDEMIYNKMNKAELQNYLSYAVKFLSKPAATERGPGRRDDVLEALKSGPMSILEIAEKLNITSKNVSSQLSYLRKEGYVIHTDEKQRKFLAALEPITQD